MADNNKSYSLPLLIVLPLKKLVKILQKVEANFLTGILIGAIFSLVVNIISNQVGEAILRQRSLEALEIELTTHHLLDTSIIDDFNKGVYKKGKAYTYFGHHYDDNIWKSLGSTTFFYSLSPEVQANLIPYYSSLITNTNNIFSNNDQLVNKYQTDWVICSFRNMDCSQELATLNTATEFFTRQQYIWALSIEKYDYDIQKIFHPTRDRLNDPILSLLMGRQAIKILSIPWKETNPTPTPK